MILVFIFLGLLIIISTLFLILILSTIKIKIKNLKLGENINKGDFEVLFQIYFLNKIKIFSIRLNTEKMRKMYSSKQLEKYDFKKIKQSMPTNKETFFILKGLKLKIEHLNLKINIGTMDAPLTSYLVAIIASLLSIILPHFAKDNKKIRYVIEPVYNKNYFSLYLDSIFSLKIVHIIYVIYKLVKKGKEKKEYERTSNRRAYAYSHEFN